MLAKNDLKQAVQNCMGDIVKSPYNIALYYDAFQMIRELGADGVSYSLLLREYLDKPLRLTPPLDNIKEFLQLRNDCLLFEAPFLFDSYCWYLEINRPLEEQFYLPRRKTLKKVADFLQKLVDDELDEVFVSMPPRTGKTTILLFFMTWIMGRDSELSNLYSAYSDNITDTFYDGIMEIITDPYTYTWNEIFPHCKIAGQNAKTETIDINRRKRYASLTCRSIRGTLNGACDCNGFLIADDLISGIEEALSKDRLMTAWNNVDNNLIPRAKEKTKFIWVGTRWSVLDPIGIRLDLLENDTHFKNVRWDSINLPALDEKGESNFDYSFDKGFSTEKFEQRRASFERNNDMASWLAQYMGEPIEREGTLFLPKDMKYFDGKLPNEVPDRVFMVVDVAFGGGDFLSAPIVYQYGDDIYIKDWVFDNGEKNITMDKLETAIKRSGVKSANFERNNGGDEYMELFEERLEKSGYRDCHFTSSPAPNTKRKETRIFEHAPEIREFYFLEEGKRDKDYDLAMQNLFSFRVVGRKNKNDDAPDSLAMVCDYIEDTFSKQFVIFQRPF